MEGNSKLANHVRPFSFNSNRSNSSAMPLPVKDGEDSIVYDGIPVKKSGGKPRATRPNSTSSSSSSSPAAWGFVVNQSKNDSSIFKSNYNHEVHRLWENYRTFHDTNILILDEEYKKMGGGGGESKERYGSITDKFKAVDSGARMGFSIDAAAAAAMKETPSCDWSPEDDGIKIRDWSREDVDAYINKLLYGMNYNVKRNPRRRRLPVFQKICLP